MVKKREIICSYQPWIDGPPGQTQQSLYGQACSNDQVTVNSWRPTWLKNYAENSKRFGPFKDKGLGQLFGAFRNKPAVVVGSGPSLRENAAGLKDLDPGIPVVSCLHNFHFMEDSGLRVDFYVSLDAGPVTIEEVTEGGSKTVDEYWAITKDRTLLAYAASDPGLIAKWQGKIYFFNCPLPDKKLMDEMDAIETFNTCISSGGNVLGASLYIAKAVFGCNPIAFLGADFSFSYLDKFHGWDSKYDVNIGSCIRMTDVYGNSVKSWQSYANFKAWFDWVAMTVPGFYVNCTEGGTFGAYPTGNIRAVIQMDLADFIRMYSLCDEVKAQCQDPTTAIKKILF